MCECLDEKLCFNRNGILFNRGNGARANLNAKTKKTERHARAQPGKHTQKTRTSEVKRKGESEKTPYWEVEFMFFWLMQNFFRASWKVCLIKKTETRTRCGRLYFQQWGNFAIAFGWLALRENIRLYFCLQNSHSSSILCTHEWMYNTNSFYVRMDFWCDRHRKFIMKQIAQFELISIFLV